jgi:hypothetical protein
MIASRAAFRVNDPKVRAAYLEMAACWRRMAEQQKAIDAVLGNLRPREQ